jgi:hypothetical protein
MLPAAGLVATPTPGLANAETDEKLRASSATLAAIRAERRMFNMGGHRKVGAPQEP